MRLAPGSNRRYRCPIRLPLRRPQRPPRIRRSIRPARAQIVGIARDAERRVLARAAHRELIAVRFPDAERRRRRASARPRSPCTARPSVPDLLAHVVRVPSRHILSLTASGTPASGSVRRLANAFVDACGVRARSVREHREIRADATVDGVDPRERRFGDLRAEASPALTCSAMRAALRLKQTDSHPWLLGDDARHAKKSALPLRRLCEHDLAIEARTRRVLARHVARFDDLRRRRDRADVEPA